MKAMFWRRFINALLLAGCWRRSQLREPLQRFFGQENRHSDCNREPSLNIPVKQDVNETGAKIREMRPILSRRSLWSQQKRNRFALQKPLCLLRNLNLHPARHTHASRKFFVKNAPLFSVFPFLFLCSATTCSEKITVSFSRFSVFYIREQ